MIDKDQAVKMAKECGIEHYWNQEPQGFAGTDQQLVAYANACAEIGAMEERERQSQVHANLMGSRG